MFGHLPHARKKQTQNKPKKLGFAHCISLHGLKEKVENLMPNTTLTPDATGRMAVGRLS